jgi:hypothetical protein
MPASPHSPAARVRIFPPRLRLLLLLAALPALTSSCSHYRLGVENRQAFSTLHVAVVESDALVPQARAIVTTQLREAFIKDGRVALVNSPEEADATLTVRLADYRRDVTVVRPDDTGLARRFDVTLRTRVTLTDNRTRTAVFADRELLARRGVFSDSRRPDDGGLIQSEYQNIPLLAEVLANDIVRAVLDRW